MRALNRQVYTLPQEPKDAIVAIFESVKELREAYYEMASSFDTILHAAPAKKIEGMIRRADGTDWNPGSGSGLYQYRGGTWHLLG